MSFFLTAKNAMEQMQKMQKRIDALPVQGKFSEREIDKLKESARADIPPMVARIAARMGVPYNRVTIRAQKTLWGSCSAERGAVTFNLFLIKAKEACIDYVVLHELTHFLYPNHSKLFYAFLSSYMPGWKERKRILDQDVVHGL